MEYNSMKKTIYISDLDGTLLSQNKEISNVTKNILNQLKKKGCNFSIATARTPATVEVILKELDIQEPIILMNGAVLYDLKNHRYLEIEFISQQVVKQVLKQLDYLIETSFIYTIDNNELIVHYQQLENEYKIAFYQERAKSPYKCFTQQILKDYTKVAYFVFLDTEDRIKMIYERVKKIDGIALVMYKDVYSKEGYILEIYSDRATKGNAINKLKRRGYENVICFGDNLNDLCMFKVADEAYAVGNAMQEVKENATAVIGNNNDDSVARFIQLHYEKIKEKENGLC